MKRLGVAALHPSQQYRFRSQSVSHRFVQVFALKHIKPEQVILAPDCGMKYLPREVADGKLKSMVQAAHMLRKEYAK